MSFSKQLTQLGLLGTFSLVGLSACTIWPGYRSPQGMPPTVVTASPPIAESAPSTPPAAPLPPAETSPASTLSAPVPMGQAPASTANSSAGTPTDVGPPPPAPPAVPPAPEPPSRGTTSAGPAAPSADSNHDQLQTQKPLEASASAIDPANGAAVPGQPVAASAPPSTGANVLVTIPQAAPNSPAAHPPGALAKLRARFHNLIQPSPKPPAKVANAGKATGPAAAPQGPPQVVTTVRIPLPMSDPNKVVMEDSRASHTISPESDAPTPLAPAAARNIQTVQAPADASGLPVDNAAPRTGENTTGSRGVEQWPFGPQAAAKSTQAPAATPSDDFDPIPVDEYKAAIVRANEATSLPAFNRTSPSASQQAANSPPNGSVPQPMAETQNSFELQIVPRAAATSPERPALPPQGNPAAQLDSQNGPQQAVSPTGPVQQTVPTAAAGGAGSVSPAIEITPASTTEPVGQTVSRPMRPAQWVGGRYGQPAWMVPYLAAPPGSSGQ
jgi:hypothetical protein